MTETSIFIVAVSIYMLVVGMFFRDALFLCFIFTLVFLAFVVVFPIILLEWSVWRITGVELGWSDRICTGPRNRISGLK